MAIHSQLNSIGQNVPLNTKGRKQANTYVIVKTSSVLISSYLIPRLIPPNIYQLHPHSQLNLRIPLIVGLP